MADFKVGRTIFYELKGSEREAFFICTVRRTIREKSSQLLLFSLFGNFPCGVTLTPSALMNPVKSISGIICIGRVTFRDYQCSLCHQKNCVYRETRNR